MSTFSSANITDGNLVRKERTNRIKIKYSMHQYSIRLHNLGNWLIGQSVIALENKATITAFRSQQTRFVYLARILFDNMQI